MKYSSNSLQEGFLNYTQQSKYYRPKKQKSTENKWFLVVIFLVIVTLTLWLGGFLSSGDKETKYIELTDEICDAAILYVKNEEKYIKLNGIDTPGKVVYVRIKDLVNSNLIPTKIKDPRTNEKIDIMTDIKLSVMAANTFFCEGFAYREDDREPPIINLKGKKIENVKVGFDYIDPGAFATDNRDGDITEKIVRSGHVNLNRPGEYYIYYSVMDRAENLSDKVTRTIVVKH
jgi:hypothetical protein